ncbi:MAG: HEPN domain-containing protein [Candidatus Freyarchaeota archaeon]
MVSGITRELAKALLREAEIDLESAKTHQREKRYHKAVLEAQQTVEKAMKAALACEGITQIAEHDPSAFFASDVVMSAPEEWVTPLREVLHDVAWLMDQYYLTRYPKVRARRVITPMDLYSEKDAVEAVSAAEKTLKTITQFIKETYLREG